MPLSALSRWIAPARRGNEFYGVNHSSNRFERQYEDTANRLDPTRRATHGSPVTWADRHGPYCFYLSDVGKGKAAFPCYQQAAYEAYNSDDAPVMNQEGPNNPMEWDEYGAAGSSSAYTLAQVIPQAVRFPINSSDPDYIFHRYLMPLPHLQYNIGLAKLLRHVSC